MNTDKLRSDENQIVDLERRCRSIARNAVQASREAHGRGQALYTDDEAARENMIEQILHLDIAKYDNRNPAIALVAEVQPNSLAITKALDALHKGLEEEFAVSAMPIKETVETVNSKSFDD